MNTVGGGNWNNITQWKNADDRHCYPIAVIGTKNYDFDKDGNTQTYLMPGTVVGAKWGALPCELSKQ